MADREGKRTAAIVLAAGKGKRMNSGIRKQYMLLDGRPLVYYSLKQFEQSAVSDIILVTGEDEREFCPGKRSWSGMESVRLWLWSPAVKSAITLFMRDSNTWEAGAATVRGIMS